MKIYEQIKKVMEGKEKTLTTSSELKKELNEKYGTNPSSIILSDYCYNRYNAGIKFDKHLFEYINRSTYKYLGESFPYTGLIFHKPKGSESEFVIGEWNEGVKQLYNEHSENSNPKAATSSLSFQQINNLFEEYSRILKYEISLLNCKPTEVRHLIGRIGEFYCAIKTKGTLAKEVNQHGFDVISNNRKISVKTTAQKSGFITINKNTFDKFDDLFVLQYVNDNFEVLYYGPKEKILKVKRTYGSNFEVDLNTLKKLMF
ncbi:DUF7225 domain-containing protein [Evansella tamaricis]|uniref:Uncharacterized protein n=1 Tax=Evansella tamaricis TaxID=2069301 RepID=A0ABS6JD80_9BACI|nr:hypothetical protein [Evansella tamaricis]MBU9711606.1 hypothetical protein [Evansella tamaricis]